MGEVIRLCDATPVDPILRKGDLVRLVGMKEYAHNECDGNECMDEEDYDFLCSLENYTGIVTVIDMIVPDDHDELPGQATWFTVAVPFEDGWVPVYNLRLHYVRRILGESTNELRGYPSQ